MDFWHKKRAGGWFYVFFLLFFWWISGLGIRPAWAGESTPPWGEEQRVERLMEETDFSQVQEALDQIMGQESFSLADAFEKIMKGEEPLSKERILDMLYRAVFGAFDRQRGILLQIILLIIVGAFFSNFARAFEKGQLGEVSFYVVYLFLFVILLGAFGNLSREMGESLKNMVLLMEGLAPAYYLAIAASTGVSTAAFFYQVILLVILVAQMVTAQLVLPLINLYVLLELVNHLSKEDLLSRMAQLVRNVAEWALRTMLGILVGLQVIQGLVTPVMDSLRRSAIGKTAGAIPGVGNAINSVTEILLTGAVLIRNSLGAVFLLALLLWGAAPLLNYAVSAFLYKLLAAMAQPVSDRRMVGCIHIVGEGCMLLLKTFFTVEVLCVIAIVVVASTR